LTLLNFYLINQTNTFWEPASLVNEKSYNRFINNELFDGYHE
jgi:hypothetical protein